MFPKEVLPLISEGAAWVAHDKARLHLAKNVELTLARNSYMPLLNAGLEMPIEGEVCKDSFTIYCVDPTDGHGKFQLVSPHRAGPKVMPDDKRRSLANLVVNVDKKQRHSKSGCNLMWPLMTIWCWLRRHDLSTCEVLAEAEVHDLEFALHFHP
ncbi:MAG: hypothetical protein IPG23_17625 [Burkholderiales bacterium]|nr:hypothetical protein [Burkholderiales bacterium]